MYRQAILKVLSNIVLNYLPMKISKNEVDDEDQMSDTEMLEENKEDREKCEKKKKET